jgi:hypothetical protein
MQTLFETAEALSPQAAWQLKHGLMLREYQHVHSLNRDGARFVCANRAMTRYASADTEDEAEQAYCERHSIAWWKLAQWNEAMAEVRRVDAGSPVSGAALAFAIPPEAGWGADEEMSLG